MSGKSSKNDSIKPKLKLGLKDFFPFLIAEIFRRFLKLCFKKKVLLNINLIKYQ